MPWAGAWETLPDSSRDWWRSIRHALGRTSSVLNFYVSSCWMRTCILAALRITLDCREQVYQYIKLRPIDFCQVSLSKGICRSRSLVRGVQSSEKIEHSPSHFTFWSLVLVHFWHQLRFIWGSTSARKKISTKICRCLSSSGTMARLKLARFLPQWDWMFLSISFNAAMSLWSIRHDVSVLCDGCRAYIQRIKDSQTGKPHCQESNLQTELHCVLHLHVWHFANFSWQVGIICGIPLCSCPSTRMTHGSASTESGKRWREQVPWHLCRYSQNGGSKHIYRIDHLPFFETLSCDSPTGLKMNMCMDMHRSSISIVENLNPWVPNFCLQPSFKFPNCYASGKDMTRSGTRTSASGSVTGKTAKSAVKSSLDSAVATMQTPAALDDVDDKGNKVNKRKGAGSTPKAPKEKSQHEQDLKKIQKDIKSFFDQDSIYCFSFNSCIFACGWTSWKKAWNWLISCSQVAWQRWQSKWYCNGAHVAGHSTPRGRTSDQLPTTL